MLDGIWSDLRFAVRGFAQRPGFTISAILILAAGIGVNTALISVVDALVLGALPYPDADRIVVVFSNNRDEGMERMVTSLPIARDWQQESTTLEYVSVVWAPATMTLLGNEAPLRLNTSVVSPAYFALSGATAQLGRVFGDEDDKAQGEHAVVILSDALWRDRFAADPDIVGTAVSLNATPYTVVGVLEPGLADFPDPTQNIDIWVPAMMGAAILGADVAETRTTRIFMALARLRDGTSMAQAQSEMDAIAEGLALIHPLSDDGWGVELVPIRELVLGHFETPLLTLLGGAALLLAIGCANVASLLLVRVSGRRRELSLRLALGASRARVARLLVLESLVLVAAGGFVGVQAAALGTATLMRLSPMELPGFAVLRLDGGALIASLGITLLVGCAAAAGPLLSTRSGRLIDSLGAAGKGLRVGGAGRIGRRLVVAEVAVAVTLLVGAGLTVRSLDRLQRADIGYEPGDLLALQLEASAATLDADDLRVLARELTYETAALAAVDQAYIWSPMVPGQAAWYTAVRPQDSPNLRDDELPLVRYHYVGPGALEGLGLRFLAGRGISDQDREGNAGAVVLSESLAEVMWPGQNPIGKILRRWNRDQWLTVVGLVQDAKLGGRQGFDTAVNRDVYFSFMQEPQRELVLLSKLDSDAPAVVDDVRQTVQGISPDFPVFDLETLESRMATQEAIPRFTTVLSVAYGLVALLLATIGLYGVLAYSVAERTREIGLRMALGARSTAVLGQVLKSGLVLTSVGLVVGLASSLALTRLIGSLLYETSPTDPVTVAGISLLLLAVAAVACAIPARRAARLDPMAALRRP